MDSSAEFEIVEVSETDALDKCAAQYGVSRVLAESDFCLRERIRDAMLVKRASERAVRGESLSPPEEPITSETTVYTIEDSIYGKLNSELERVRDENMQLRSCLLNVRHCANNGSWAGVYNELDKLAVLISR